MRDHVDTLPKRYAPANNPTLHDTDSVGASFTANIAALFSVAKFFDGENLCEHTGRELKLPHVC